MELPWEGAEKQRGQIGGIYIDTHDTTRRGLVRPRLRWLHCLEFASTVGDSSLNSV